MQIDKIVRLTSYDLVCIDRAIEYIHKRYKERISADQLSVEVNLRKEKLQAGFKKKTGFTLHDYILKVRIDRAKTLLLGSNEPVKFICDLIGFKDESHFIKVFKRHTYTTPAEFRYQESA